MEGIICRVVAQEVSYSENNEFMDRTERFYKIDALLQANRFVPIDRMLRELEVSRATFKRDIDYMRERLNAPIEWDRDQGGYIYAGQLGDRQQALPGLWFNSSEAYALLMMQALLAEMQPGLLGSHIEPLKARLRAVIESGQHPASDVESRVRLVNVAVRAVPNKNFEVVAAALLGRERLEIDYYGRGRDESSLREVSPQLLIHYRGNWYLAAWCHKQKAMRSFAMDAIQKATVLPTPSKAISKRELEGFVGQGYGIFSGATVRWATLRFSAERARWVSRELWHPLQRSAQDESGRLVLELPFTDTRELSMDVLRHGRHVEVIEPTELRLLVEAELRHALEQYSSAE
jgi:predicted DNA-binding transcriptional regulator YafY